MNDSSYTSVGELLAEKEQEQKTKSLNLLKSIITILSKLFVCPLGFYLAWNYFIVNATSYNPVSYWNVFWVLLVYRICFKLPIMLMKK